MKYRTDTFGDVKQHKCLVALADELNKLYEQKPGKSKARYVATLIKKYHATLYVLGVSKGMIDTIKPTLLRYVFEDFRRRVLNKNLPLNLETHILCFLTGLYRAKLEEYAKSTKR